MIAYYLNLALLAVWIFLGWEEYSTGDWGMTYFCVLMACVAGTAAAISRKKD